MKIAEFKIEKGIPYKRINQKTKESVPQLPLDQMEPGDSILLSKVKEVTHKDRVLWYQRVNNQAKKKGIESKFRIGKASDGLRLWKQEEEMA